LTRFAAELEGRAAPPERAFPARIEPLGAAIMRLILPELRRAAAADNVYVALNALAFHQTDQVHSPTTSS
jgi:hypothetical protein